jgi:hypothetical protein
MTDRQISALIWSPKFKKSLDKALLAMDLVIPTYAKKITYLIKKHKFIRIDVSGTEFVVLHIHNYSVGVLEDGTPTPIHRIASASGDYRGTGFRGGPKDMKDVTPGLEISFLPGETREVSLWLADNLPLVKVLPSFQYLYKQNIEIGSEPRYTWTQPALDAYQRARPEKYKPTSPFLATVGDL